MINKIVTTSFQTGDEPPYLAVGTEVSAKYRGAFCEAKVKKLVRSVKCKVCLITNLIVFSTGPMFIHYKTFIACLCP